MIAKYGQSVVDELLAKRFQIYKVFRDYDEESKHWRVKTKELLKKF